MKKYYEVLQEENCDCGICCLSSIIKYYKGDIPLETLRINTNTSSEGCNAYDLVNYAKKIGFNVISKKIKYIENERFPLIAHLKLDNNLFHFVVVYEFKNNYVLVMDPSIGLKKIKLNKFNELFTGVILYFEPISTIVKYKKNKFISKKIIEFIKKNKTIFSIIFVISFIILLLSLINNISIKLLSNNLKNVYILFLIIFILNLLIYLKRSILLKININFNNNILIKFIKHIFNLPLNYLKLKQKGEIITRFNELNDLSKNILDYIIELIFNIILLLNLLLVIIIYTQKLSIILFIISLIYLIYNIIIYKKLINKIRYLVSIDESYNSNIIDYITKFTTIKHLNNYKYFIDNTKNILEEKNTVFKSINKKVYKVDFINKVIIDLTQLLVLYYIIKNNINITNGLLIYMLICYYINLLKQIIDYYPSFILYKSIINKNNDFLSINLDKKKDISINNYEIKINNLNYDINGKYIIKNLNYVIKENDKIFISGPSGIGKSTLLKILSNEIINYEGDILINNKLVSNYNLNNVVSYVSQDEELFNDTILNNLTLGKEMDKELLNNVIRICKLDTINIIKSVGLDSFIINNNFLSGGEKNRIILARGLIYSKKIIILDEVLKEVDYNLEVTILKDILEYFKDRTIIYVSHKNVSNLFDKVLTFRKE